MIAALRRLGFDRVFDVDNAADVTIMEEGTELLNRLKNGGKLPPHYLLLPGLGQILRDLLPPISWRMSPPARARSRCSAP